MKRISETVGPFVYFQMIGVDLFNGIFCHCFREVVYCSKNAVHLSVVGSKKESNLNGMCLVRGSMSFLNF